MSLIEVMISLAITAMLLTAAGAAFSATSSAIEANDEFTRACQSARVALNQMLTGVRRADRAAYDIADEALVLNPDGAAPTSYLFNAAEKKLMLKVGGRCHTLASNVAAATFAADNDAEGYALRVSIALTVEVGTHRVRLAGSAAPRRVQVYQQ